MLHFSPISTGMDRSPMKRLNQLQLDPSLKVALLVATTTCSTAQGMPVTTWHFQQLEQLDGKPRPCRWIFARTTFQLMASALVLLMSQLTATILSALVRVVAEVRKREPAYSNSVGVGFRTFNGTNATVNYDGVESGDVGYTLPAGEWVSVKVSMTRSGDGANISASVGGESVFTDFALAGAPDDFRIQIAGRTGGAAMDLGHRQRQLGHYVSDS